MPRYEIILEDAKNNHCIFEAEGYCNAPDILNIDDCNLGCHHIKDTASKIWIIKEIKSND